jgi:Beta-galactosidase/beta-glucuronidase
MNAMIFFDTLVRSAGIKVHHYLFIPVASLFLLYSCSINQDNAPARKYNFDKDWLFHYGDIQNPHAAVPDTAEWVAVELPHDWSIEMPFKKSAGGYAIGQTQGGISWYRKTFITPKNEMEKRRLLYFEGIYMESEVWVNGKQASFHPYGYTSFFCDITNYCNPPGQENIVAVKAKNEGKNSRWYAGSGIYRHVWMITTGMVHLDEWRTFITTDVISGEKAKVNIAVDVFNKNEISAESTLSVIIKDNSDNIVGKQDIAVNLKASESKKFNLSVEVTNPDLWSVDSPTLYAAEIKLESGNSCNDIITIPFGIRCISFSANEGFLLNGKSLKLKGGCVHHDNGLLGAVAIDRAEERKVELLKAHGYNAVRCAHNPPSEKFLEACDRLGILVIDEAFDQWQKQKNPDDYHLFFYEWHEKDLTSMILRDRNHPSIIMWSIGNEIKERSDSSGVVIARRLKEIVQRYDNTRPVTAAINDYWDNPKQDWSVSPLAFASLDVSGYNYMLKEYENDIKLFPDRVLYGSETTAMERAANWDMVELHPSIIGDFIWTAIDYLGESGIGHALNIKKGEKEPPLFLDWPWFNAWCGDIDICGYKKPQAAIRDILWNKSKIEMLVHRPIPEGYEQKITYWGWPDNEQSWNWEGLEGQLMDVTVYTKYPSVQIYLNGEKLDEKITETKDAANRYTAKFKVKYEPGTLKAVGVNSGYEKESASLTTTGKAVKIRLKADRTDIINSKNDLSYIQAELIDKDGNIIPDNDIVLKLNISGNGRILAAGNADPTDMESFRSLTPKTYKGKALIIVQPQEGDGNINLDVTSSFGLETLIIKCRQVLQN